MKIKKCPYCGKRVSYSLAFSSRRKALYICPRCGKESKVTINKKILILFAICVLIAVAIMMLWIFADLTSNPLGVALVALPLVIFAFVSTRFLNYEPLKKYKKSMEAKKAGIEYSDNLITSELEEKETVSFENTGQFNLNSDLFNKIKAERTAAREKLQNTGTISDSSKIKTDETKSVPIIYDISENHTSTDTPLKKIHKEQSVVTRTRHYIPEQEDLSATKVIKKPAGNKYSANRKF
jgi:DNA-directed RNA polymerase subunit RPC12/RpoP